MATGIFLGKEVLGEFEGDVWNTDRFFISLVKGKVYEIEIERTGGDEFDPRARIHCEDVTFLPKGDGVRPEEELLSVSRPEGEGVYKARFVAKITGKHDIDVDPGTIFHINSPEGKYKLSIIEVPDDTELGTGTVPEEPISDTVDTATDTDTDPTPERANPQPIQGTKNNDTIIGRDGADILIGRQGDDSLKGAKGDDSLNGGEGKDFLRGGMGDDALIGGEGDDTLIGGDGDDSQTGGLGNDVLYGSRGDDTINGGEGNDTIGGESGNNLLIGGGGSDTFVYVRGMDTIEDFSSEDKIHLVNLDQRLSSYKEVLSKVEEIPSGGVKIVFQSGSEEIHLPGIDDVSYFGADDFIL